jgi:hypothetical protein
MKSGSKKMDEGGAVMQLMGIVKIVWVDAGAGDS